MKNKPELSPRQAAENYINFCYDNGIRINVNIRHNFQKENYRGYILNGKIIITRLYNRALRKIYSLQKVAFEVLLIRHPKHSKKYSKKKPRQK
jgi:hypothetical protein